MTQQAQLPASLFDVWTCPTCGGSGRRDDGAACRVCEGTGRVSYDPDDRSEIPF